MKILLTGSTGFLGKELTPVLEQAGHDLWHLVRSPKGFAREICWDFCSRLPMDVPRVDGVIHLAAKAYFGSDLDKEQYAVNVLSAGHLAKYAHENGALLIFSSGVIVHGNVSLIGKETPLNPLNHYAMTKLLAEELIKTWSDDYCILRIGGIYGLDGPTHLGLNRSISEAFYHKTVPVLRGSGQGRRNYILVSDLARWIAALMDERQAGGRRASRVIYCAGSETIAIRDYLRSVSSILADTENCEEKEGSGSMDFLVEGDTSPFVQTKFEDYLRELLHERKGL